MLLLKPIDRFLHTLQLLYKSPASVCITDTHLQYEIIALFVASLTVEIPVDNPFVQVIDNDELQFRQYVVISSSGIAVEQRAKKDDVYLDYMQTVKFGSVLLDGLTYHLWYCQSVIKLLTPSCFSEVPL